MKTHILKYSLLVLLALCGFGSRIQAQDTLTFRSVEDLSYRYFLNQQWDSLVTIGKAGLHQDIDYYYLRLRMGIACFNRGNYARAIQHLNRADKFNSDDSTTLEYLYYSYRSLNRSLYQNKVSKRFLKSTRDRVLKHFPLYTNSFYPNFGYQFDKAFNISDNQLIGRPTSNLYGEVDYPQSFMFFGLDYRHYFGGLALNFSYYHFDSRREKKVLLPLYINTRKYNVSEHHFYLNTEISVKNKLTIIPAVQYQYLKYSKFNAVWNPSDSIYTFPDSNFINNNIVASLGLYKDVGPFSLGLTVSYSRLYNKNFYQGALMFTWFPFGNMNLYTTTTVAWMQMQGLGLAGQGKGLGAIKADASNSGADKSHPVFEEAIGGKVWKKLWLEGQFAYNGLRGYNKANASIVYNNPEQVNYSIGFTGVYEVTKVLDLTVGYQYSQKDLTGIHYTYPNNFVTDHYLNNSQLIYGGIKWKL